MILDFSTFLEGPIIGVAVAAPVRPIGVLCIRRTLNHGPLAGFMSGLGAATADAFYGFVAAFGLMAVSEFLLDMETRLRLGGGTFLIWLGLRAWRSRPNQDQAAQNKRGLGLLAGYLATTFLILANPSTILSFLAIFAGLGLASVFRQRLGDGGMIWINRLSALLLAGFGMVIVLGTS